MSSTSPPVSAASTAASPIAKRPPRDGRSVVIRVARFTGRGLLSNGQCPHGQGSLGPELLGLRFGLGNSLGRGAPGVRPCGSVVSVDSGQTPA